MTAKVSTPEPGAIVRVRQRLYLVEDVSSAPQPGDATVVRMSCVDDDAQGQALDVLWELELDAEIVGAESWDSLVSRGFDPPDQFGAYFNTLRWNCVTSTDPSLLQSPFRAGIRLDPYQLEPLRKALRLPRVNLFIADDVGLGKTIEAGLIARELLLRKKVREIVVSCPPSMLLQWQEELQDRFGLRFEILDKDYVQQTRRDRGFSINPWATHSRFLISHRLLIDEAYTGPLRDWLGSFRAGSLLIVDEAHHAAPSSGQRYAIDSKITRAFRDLAPRFEHRLFLSATPHNGHSNSFSALLEILDPQRFCRGVKPLKDNLDRVLVRRLKDDLRKITGGFPERCVEQVDIQGLPDDAPELKLARLLDEYRRMGESRLAGESRRTQTAAGLLICGLQKRLFSSVEAFSRTLRIHRRTVERHRKAAEKAAEEAGAAQLELLTNSVGADDDRAQLSEEELRVEEEAEIEAASKAALSRLPLEQEDALLSEMTNIAEESRALPDAKVQYLVNWIRDNMCPGLPEPGVVSETPPKWKDLRVIIFTEWEDTRRYLQQQLQAAVSQTDRADERIEVYQGPTPPDKREAIKRAFNADPKQHPVRILIATDAAREGLNLQAHCCHLFHFDVPWNPSRMEQRNGRIDRKLQPHPVVYSYYFFYKQRPEDRILVALVRKTRVIREELGSLAQVIDARLTRLLKQGIRRTQLTVLADEIEQADIDPDQKSAVREELEDARQRELQLREQVERLRGMLDRSQKAVGLKEAHFRSALSCSLEILGAERLNPTQDGAPGPDRFEFPALDQRTGADSSWADTMDSLRAPRSRDQRFYEWRRSSPIRPVVFEDPGVVTDDVVQLHLEHRMVQRLLGRFLAQGFVLHDLSRACLAQTRDAIPRVILLGRLALYGPGAARLHEEVIPVTARWTDPKIRKSELSPYARDTEARTVELFYESLVSKPTRPILETVAQQLREGASRDVAELLPHLTSRGEDYARDAIEKLNRRAEDESKTMREILETQKRHIEATVEKYSRPDVQLTLPGMKDEERRQLQDNQRYWQKRLASLDRELEEEPGRIRELYQVQARRLEPVGLVYLWPVTG